MSYTKHNTVDSVIKTESYACTNGKWDLPFTRVKDEQSMENGEKCKLTSDTKGHIKMEDTSAVDVKVEVQESGMDSLELDMLTEELDIKPEIENVDAESDGVANQIQTENELGVVHRKSNQGAFICYICNFIVHSKKDLINHFNVSGCSVKSCAKKALTVNKIIKHPEAQYPVETRQCIHCNATFKRKISLHDHIVRKHEEFITSVSSKIHQCKHCSYKTTTITNLTRHLTKHPESGCNVTPKQYPCNHCHAIFKGKVSLDDHMIRNHEEFSTSVSSKIHQCIHCIYKTTNVTNLTRHLTKHPESGCSITPKQYPCDHCHAIFKSRVYLDNHVLKMHEEFISSVSSKIHQCEHCSYKTTKATILTRHLTKHPESGCGVTPKQYPCNHCHAVFKRKANLDYHIIRNHEEFITSVSSKIHECKHCSYKTTVMAILTRHYLSKHPK